jgi:hypothetical protein
MNRRSAATLWTRSEFNLVRHWLVLVVRGISTGLLWVW